jgi:sugar phosphate isomerase/epimerase
MISRRSFITSSLSAFGVSALPAIEPIRRAGRSRMQLGVAAYSFRDRFQWSQGKEQQAKAAKKPWSMFDFIDWCADNNVPGAEVTSYFFPPDPDEAFLLAVKRHAYLRGVQLTGTAVGNNFALPLGEKRDAQIAHVKRWIDHAAIMNAPHIRIFAGQPPKDLPEEVALANCLAAYQECLDHAGKKGIFLGLENHHGLVAKPENLIHLVSKAESPWAGINWDSGNFQTEDPYADLAKIAPYAINVQLKMEISRDGKTKEPSDVDRVIRILRDANYQGWFTLEYEVHGADPLIEIPKILNMLRPKLA